MGGASCLTDFNKQGVRAFNNNTELIYSRLHGFAEHRHIKKHRDKNGRNQAAAGTADSNDFLIILGNTPLAENGRRHVCARALSGCVFIYAAAKLRFALLRKNPFT